MSDIGDNHKEQLESAPTTTIHSGLHPLKTTTYLGLWRISLKTSTMRTVTHPGCHM